MKKILFIFLLTSFQSVAQQTSDDDSNANKIVLSGVYTGKNIYVQNCLADPVTKAYCADSVIINGKRCMIDLNRSAFEIDLCSFVKKLGTDVTIIIYHKSTCRPKLISTIGFPPPGKYELTFLEIDSTGHVHITTLNESPSANKLPLHIDQYRGSEWRTVLTIHQKPGANNTYDTIVRLTAGRNVFRLSKHPYDFSSIMVNVDHQIPEITCSLDTSENCITCSDTVYYRMENRCMEILSSGSAQKIDVSKLYNGSYKMFYENNLFSFEIKRRKK